MREAGQTNHILDAIRELSGDSVADSLIRGFNYFEVAEQRIELAMERHPQEWAQWDQKMKGFVIERTFDKGPIWDSFYFLNPSAYVPREQPEFLTRHFDELLDRVAYFEENTDYTPKNKNSLLLKQLAPTTDPEIVVGFSKAPFNRLGVNCYSAVFKRIFPEQAEQILTTNWSEDWEGQVDQMIWGIKKKYSQQRAEARNRGSKLTAEGTIPRQMKLL